MASLKESALNVTVALVWNANDTPRAILTATSLTSPTDPVAPNVTLRTTTADVTALMDPTLQAEALHLLTTAIAYVKTLWDIEE